MEPDVVMHTFSLSIWAAQADGPVQPSLHNETLSQRKRKEICVCPHICGCGYVHISAGLHRSQRC